MQNDKQPCRLTADEQDGMRAAGAFNAQVMDFIRPQIIAGITTAEIDRLVHTYTCDHGHTPTQLGYRVGRAVFAHSCCTSVNDVICHGVPCDYVLTEGDIVNVDLTTTVGEWIGDQSETFFIGTVSKLAREVTQAAFDCLHLGIQAIRPGGRVSSIGKAIVAEAKRRKFSVVTDYVGHSIGRTFHAEPSIPHAPNLQAHRDRIYPGMCFTIEPMINTGRRHTVLDHSDGWTVRTQDGGLSAQFEHTLLMTEDGPEILTQTKNGPQAGHRFE